MTANKMADPAEIICLECGAYLGMTRDSEHDRDVVLIHQARKHTNPRTKP